MSDMTAHSTDETRAKWAAMPVDWAGGETADGVVIPAPFRLLYAAACSLMRP